MIENFQREALFIGKHCVDLSIPMGIIFKYNMEYEIKSPLSPLDWYALIKYSSGYVGQNMHPIIVALHNAIPLYSFDNYGNKRFYKIISNKNSSKIFQLLKIYSATENRCTADIRFFNPLNQK